MQLTMTFRNAQISDLEEINFIVREVINNNYRSFMGDIVDLFLESEAITLEISENLSQTFVWEDNDKIVGVCILIKNLIHLLMIKFSEQQKGYGTLFLHDICAYLFQKYSKIKLETADNNLSANAFYQKNGWQVFQKISDPMFNCQRVQYQKLKNNYS